MLRTIYIENHEVDVENSSFGYDLTHEILISDGLSPVTKDPLDSETSPLEGGALHHGLGAVILGMKRVQSTVLT